MWSIDGVTPVQATSGDVIFQLIIRPVLVPFLKYASALTASS
jgi:hypothetical protein